MFYCRIFVQNPTVEGKLLRGDKDILEDIWLAVVHEIRSNEDGRLAEIFWYYNFADAERYLERPSPE
jgi:hypothetical protein